MATVIAGMTTSVDGFIADARGSVGRLYPDLAALRGSAYMDAAIEETGAVLMGRRTFEMGDPDSYVGNYEFQVPIVVLTHHPPVPPPKQDVSASEPAVLRQSSYGREASNLRSTCSGAGGAFIGTTGVTPFLLTPQLETATAA
jgi:dihydrofolate reductase